LVFAGEAYNVEQGVTNEMFPNERDDTPGCQFNKLPEDHTILSTATPTSPSGFAPSDLSSDLVNFANYMRLLAPPAPVAPTADTVNGMNQFINVGCADCHIVSHITGQSAFAQQSGVTYQPFSDYALHDMGMAVKPDVPQGAATAQQFRTAPLWG